MYKKYDSLRTTIHTQLTRCSILTAQSHSQMHITHTLYLTIIQYTLDFFLPAVCPFFFFFNFFSYLYLLLKNNIVLNHHSQHSQWKHISPVILATIISLRWSTKPDKLTELGPTQKHHHPSLLTPIFTSSRSSSVKERKHSLHSRLHPCSCSSVVASQIHVCTCVVGAF